MSNNPLDGITFHDVPVEEKIVNDEMEKNTKEAIEERDSEVRNKKRTIYHDIGIPKINGKKSTEDRSTRTVLIPQSKINKEYYKMNIQSAKSIRDGVIAVLLTGDEYTCKAITETLKKEATHLKGKKNTTTISSCLTTLKQNKEFSKLLIKKDISTNKGGKIFSYKLNTAATDLTLKEATGLADTRNKNVTMKTLLHRYPELFPFTNDTEKEVEKTTVEDKKEVKETIDISNTIDDILPKYLEETIKNKLGIEVTVRGNISILFGFIGNKNS